MGWLRLRLEPLEQAVSDFVSSCKQTVRRLEFLCSVILPLCCLESLLSPVVTDGPEYSRLSESLKQTHWYAEGHTDPREDPEDRERARSYRQEEEREKKRKESEERRRKASEERRMKRMENDESSSDEGGAEDSNKPRDPQDLSPKVLNTKRGDVPSQTRTDEARETTEGVNGNSADDESTPPSNTDRTSTSSPKGAHYIPATSIQAAPGGSGQTPAAFTEWSYPDEGILDRVTRFLTSTALFVFTILVFVFTLFSYLTIMMWLDPNLHEIIREKVLLRPSAFSTSSFHQNADIRLEVFFYNITYQDDPEGIPLIHVNDVGPYTYKVTSSKTEVTWNRNTTMSYRIRDSFHFQPNKSVGDQSDVINAIDANVLAKLSKMKVGNRSKNYHVNLTQGMVRPQTVGDILWGGSDVEGGHGKQNETDKAKETSEDMSKSKTSKKEAHTTNESLSPMYNIYTGRNDLRKLNRMYTFNYSRADRMWPHGHDHYPMSGSADGDAFPPFVSKGQTLAFFYGQTERNLLLQREKSVAIKGREAYRFVLPRNPIEVRTQLQSATQGGHEDEDVGVDTQTQKTPPESDDVIDVNEDASGAPPREPFALQYLRRDSPFLVSFIPKNYHNPQGNGNESCKMHLDVHPASGITLRKRLCHQMSLPVVYPGRNGSGFILPIMWVDWFYESVPDDLDQVMTSYRMLTVTYFAKMTFITLLVLVAFVLLMQIFATFKNCGKKQGGTANYAMMTQGDNC